MKNGAKNRDYGNYKSTKDKICITNGEDIKYIYKNSQIPDGWYKGNCKLSNKKRDMSKYYGNKEAQIKNSQSKSGVKNSMFGNGYRVSGGNNGHAIYIYTYKGVEYFCRKDLMIILKQEFPTITENAIRLIVNNTYTSRISNKYQPIIDNLTWRLKYEN